jgi:hypothetical protein
VELFLEDLLQAKKLFFNNVAGPGEESGIFFYQYPRPGDRHGSSVADQPLDAG